MDWNKVKTILIVVLICLNLFLFCQIYNSKLSENQDKVILNDVLTVLNNRNVKILCDLPGIDSSVQFLHLGMTSIEKDTVLSVFLGYDKPVEHDRTEFEKNGKKIIYLDKLFNHFYFVDHSDKSEIVVDIHNKKDVISYTLKKLEELGVIWNEYSVDNYVPGNKDTTVEVRITQKYKGNLVYDNFIHAFISNTGVVYLEISCHKISGMENDNTGKLLKPFQVLLGFFTEDISDTNVLNIDQGFKISLLDKEEIVSESQAGLCWRILTDSGRVYYVSLINGREVK